MDRNLSLESSNYHRYELYELTTYAWTYVELNNP